MPVDRELHLTRHGAKRIAQRRIAEGDIDLIATLGTEVEGGYLFRKRDFQAADRELRQWRQRLRRLIGKRVVIVDGCIVVTAYHADRRTERRLLRSA